MTKILLVEDDKSLREIYGVRLFAEGYDVVSAGDGEEALALAIKERPMLIITDVMMPKISGFDMLDILRSTTETKDIKVIVMTALGSEDNKDRGERLGADKYLVKSQVGIEDVVRVVHELLGDQAPAPAATPGVPGAAPGSIPGMATMPVPATPAAPARPAAPVPPRPPAAPAMPVAPPPIPAAPPPVPPASTRGGMVSSPHLPAPGMPANQVASTTMSAAAPTPAAAQPSASPNEPRRTRVIQPLGDPSQQRVDIQALVDKELAKEGGTPAATTDEERQLVNSQINNFANQPAPAPDQLPPVTPPVAAPPADNTSAQPPMSPTQMPPTTPPAA